MCQDIKYASSWGDNGFSKYGLLKHESAHFVAHKYIPRDSHHSHPTNCDLLWVVKWYYRIPKRLSNIDLETKISNLH